MGREEPVVGQDHKVSESGSSDLAKELIDLGYVELFMRQDDDSLSAIWTRPDAPARLEELAVGEDAPGLARFLAAEILFRKQKDFPTAAAASPLASVYAKALSDNFTTMANPWGLPGSLDGQVAQHFLALGKAALPQLEKLLDNRDEILYGGSKEATVGNSYRFRVKDMAASLIAALAEKQLELDPDPARRDREIETLRSSS
jgi:hypothetical protein